MRLFYLACLIAVISGCDIFDKDEQIPSWILINESSLISDVATEGEPTSDIVDATVFANDFFVGTFELPAAVPILEEGPTRITVAGGIRNNGLSSNRVIYPFYEPWEEVVDLKPAEKIAIGTDTALTYEYFPNINFLVEGFEESLDNILDDRPDNNAQYSRIEGDPENIRSGTGSLEVILTPETGIFEVETATPIGNITPGNPIYLEIDFKGNHPLEVGVIGVSSQGEQKTFAAGLNPQEEWTKVYIELTNEVGSLAGSFAFKIYFESRLQGLTTEKKLYLDNIKVVYI
jgi:hypothetical protein